MSLCLVPSSNRSMDAVARINLELPPRRLFQHLQLSVRFFYFGEWALTATKTRTTGHSFLNNAPKLKLLFSSRMPRPLSMYLLGDQVSGVLRHLHFYSAAVSEELPQRRHIPAFEQMLVEQIRYEFLDSSQPSYRPPVAFSSTNQPTNVVVVRRRCIVFFCGEEVNISF